tara:strand:+ start:30 stop:1286 length:1257 start_codon:yes stop_codon:yes gene_type:complete
MNDIYDWVIIGGGIAGIAIAEVLSRNNKKVKIVEKSNKLSSETTREFHEWVHTGSLYTLKFGQQEIQKTMLGALDDIFLYYSSFKNMNLKQTANGLAIKTQNQSSDWFKDEKIYFKYKIKGRKLNILWMYRVARSIVSIELVKEHNWLRYQGGSKRIKLSPIKVLLQLIKLFKHKPELYTIDSSDFTSNSRNILNDLYQNSLSRGLTVSFNNQFKSFEEKNEIINVLCSKENFTTKNLVLCNGKNIADIFVSKIKTSYAPMLITEGIPSSQAPYVELDDQEENCINYLGKANNIGLMGGISFDSKEMCENYFKMLISKLKKLWPTSKVLHQYVGEKNELVPDESPRNYQYFIWKRKNKNIWATIPGKFSLFPSLATEFYRRKYLNNTIKVHEDYSTKEVYNSNKSDISDIIWNEFNLK